MTLPLTSTSSVHRSPISTSLQSTWWLPSARSSWFSASWAAVEPTERAAACCCWWASHFDYFGNVFGGRRSKTHYLVNETYTEGLYRHTYLMFSNWNFCQLLVGFYLLKLFQLSCKIKKLKYVGLLLWHKCFCRLKRCVNFRWTEHTFCLTFRLSKSYKNCWSISCVFPQFFIFLLIIFILLVAAGIAGAVSQNKVKIATMWLLNFIFDEAQTSSCVSVCRWKTGWTSSWKICCHLQNNLTRWKVTWRICRKM